MAKVSPMLVLLVAKVITMCGVEGKHWPDFSCHPSNNTYLHRNSIKYHGAGWRSCQEPYKNWNVGYPGACDKVCMLLNTDVLFRMKPTDPLIFDIDAFMKNLAMEMGYKTATAKEMAEPQKEVMIKVRTEMESCKHRHPEYASLNVKNTPCEPWSNITRCIETAVVRQPEIHISVPANMYSINLLKV